LTSRLGKCSAQLLSISVSSIGFIASLIIPERDYRQSLETRAVTFYVFRISEHTRITHVLFVLAPVLFPLCHVIKASRLRQAGGSRYLDVEKHGLACDRPPSMCDYPCPGPVLFMVALYCRTRSDNQASSAGSSVQEISSLLLLATTQAHSLLTYANAGRSFNQRSIPRSPWMLSPWQSATRKKKESRSPVER